MTTKTLGAFTEPGGFLYPPYINVSYDARLDVMTTTIRSPSEEREGITYPGAQSMMILEAEEFALFIGEIISNCDDDIKERIIKAATESE